MSNDLSREEKQRQESDVFINTNGEYLVRLPSLFRVMCLQRSCRTLQYCHSPENARLCMRCGAPLQPGSTEWGEHVSTWRPEQQPDTWPPKQTGVDPDDAPTRIMRNPLLDKETTK